MLEVVLGRELNDLLTFITVPSSFINSLMTRRGVAQLHRSTAASVCPERSSTPPSRAISGKM
jgi:hypothetical protein